MPTTPPNVNEIDELKKKLAEAESRANATEQALASVRAAQQETEVAAFFSEQARLGRFAPANEAAVKGYLRALYAAEVNMSPAGVKLFSELTGGAGLVGGFRNIIGALPAKPLNMGETMPAAGAPQPGVTPGAPAATPQAQLFTDGVGREYPVVNTDILSEARTLMAKEPNRSKTLSEAAIQIQKLKANTATPW